MNINCFMWMQQAFIPIAHCDQNTSATVLKLMAQANTTGYMFLKHITGARLPGAA